MHPVFSLWLLKILAPLLQIHNKEISFFSLCRMQVVWVELCLNFLCPSQKGRPPSGGPPVENLRGVGHFGEKDLPCKSARFYNEVISNKKRGKPQWHNFKFLLWWWSLGKKFLLKHVFLQELVLSKRPNPHHWFKIFWNILWKHDTAQPSQYLSIRPIHKDGSDVSRTLPKTQRTQRLRAFTRINFSLITSPLHW